MCKGISLLAAERKGRGYAPELKVKSLKLPVAETRNSKL
jgi:hypothetical protein